MQAHAKHNATFPPLLTLFCLLVSVISSTACGHERWPVKVGTDADAARVHLVPVWTTLERLTQLPLPGSPAAMPTHRFAPTELTVFTLTAALVEIRREADEDYHLVLRDAQGRTMIVEAPHPFCAPKSRFAAQIAAVRRKIEAYFGGPIRRRLRPQHLQVTVTGVGFFDALHGQAGVARNGIELHPVLAVEFVR